MLTALHRSAPLRQRLAKGYQVLSSDGNPRDIVDALLRRPPELASLPLTGGLVLRGSPRVPGAVWIDTGPVFLHDTVSRARVADALAVSVATTAEAAARRGALLVPSGWGRTQSGAPASLCGDLHSLEVLNEVQRELICNLVREKSPVLIALTGRQAHGSAGAALTGSTRLAESTDQVTTRYIASFSPRHLERVVADLRRTERLARLEAMDVNPFGEAEAGAQGYPTLRLIDAQMSVSSAMAHALLVQALAMRARDLERSGRRVGAFPPKLLERNRSRAIAHGLTAVFDAEQRTEGRKRAPTDRKPTGPRSVPADREARSLLRSLLPYFRQLDATAEELSQLFLGVELSSGSRSSSFVRNENDLVSWWRGQGRNEPEAERIGALLRSPQWLTADHISAANRAEAPGSTAAAQAWLAEMLSPFPPSSGEAASSGRRQKRQEQGSGTRGQGRGRRGPTPGEALVKELRRPGIQGGEVLRVLRSHCRSTSVLDLLKPLRALEREQAKAVRRLLRPRPEHRFRLDAPLPAWDDHAVGRAVHTAATAGMSLLHWDVPDEERRQVRSRLRTLGDPPKGLACVLITDTSYTAKPDQRRGTVEVLLVARTEKAAR